MVQVTYAQPAQQRQPMTKGEMSTAAGVSGVSAGLNEMIQEMHKQKDIKRISDYNSQINMGLAEAAGHPELGQFLGANDPKDSILFLKNLAEYGGQQNVNSLTSAMRGGGQGGIYGGQNGMQGGQGGMQGGMGGGQGNMPSMQAQMMQNENLPYQDRPALVEPGYDEQQMQPQMQQQMQQQMQPQMQDQPQQPQITPAQKLAQVDQEYERLKPNIQGTQNQKLFDQQYRSIRNSIIQEGNLEARTKSANISEKVAQKSLQELPKQLADKLSKFEDMATRADQSINAVENIDSLLAQGAQMPEIIQDINLKLGTDNPLSRFATNLAASDLSKAVETARVQQFTGMKDVFGGTIRIAEFNEFIKKLQDVRDPEVSNKVKSVLLKQFANMEKFPYEGLSKAVEENRNAPSDVIMKKGKIYADQMVKDYSKKSKAEMDNIINQYKNKEEAEKGYVRMISPEGVAGKVLKKDLKQAMNSGYKKQ
jgi:hypothetical protein